MGFFNFERELSLDLPTDERSWVDENFSWLISVLGYPQDAAQWKMSAESFPNSYGTQPTAEVVLEDLKQLLDLPFRVHIQRTEPTRSFGLSPLATEGTFFETELDIRAHEFVIHISDELEQRPHRLLHRLCYEMANIWVAAHLDPSPEEDVDESFVYLLGIFLQLGALLAQNMISIERETDGEWERTYQIGSDIPEETYAYALALYAHLTDTPRPEWEGYLPTNLRSYFRKASQFLTKHPSPLRRSDPANH